MLLDAAVLAERSSLRLSFVLVGEGPLTSALHSEIRRRKLEHMVRFYPHVPFERAMVMVKAADAVYIGFEPEDPNNHFASPNKLFESMAMGTPVLTCGFGLLGSLVRRFRCGVTLKSVAGAFYIGRRQRARPRGFQKTMCSERRALVQVLLQLGRNGRTTDGNIQQSCPNLDTFLFKSARIEVETVSDVGCVADRLNQEKDHCVEIRV